MAREGSEDVYGTFNMLMRRKVGLPSAHAGVSASPCLVWGWLLL